jgi:hypothetical protein
MSNRCRARRPLRLITTVLLLGVSTSVPFVPALPPVPPAVLILCLPLWAAAYAGFALLYAALEAPPAAHQGRPESDSRGMDPRR